MRRVLVAGVGIALVLTVVLMLPVVAQAKTVYVSVVGSDTIGVGTLANPYRTVQHAVNIAAVGDLVHVGAGTFNGAVTMRDGISLEATGAGTGVFYTTLTTSVNFASVVTATNVGAGTHISGFKISGVSSGWGISLSNSSPRISDNWVTGNLIGIGCFGNSSPTITNCEVTENTGNGIVCNGSSPTIFSNFIWQNHVAGILCTATASPSITDNIITSNWSRGVECGASSPSITGNVIGGSSRGIRCSNSSSPSITNNSIDGGNPNGIECDSSSPSITGNTISDCTDNGIICNNGSSPTIANDTFSGNFTGISCNDSSSPEITNCTITGEGIAASGYGIDCYNGSSATVTSVTITATSHGIWCYYSSPVITRSTVSGNWMGIIGRGSSATIANCVVSDGEDGIDFDSGSAPSITNATVTGNGQTGIRCDGTSVASIANCIVWNPGAPELTGCTATYSDVLGGAAGAGNIDVDPSFVNAAAGDFHLSAGSPCIDTGAASGAPATDRDGTHRPLFGGWDMGAYEYHSATVQLHYLAGSDGTLFGVTSQTVSWGANGTAVTASPATGYHFVKWSDESIANPRTDSNVTSDATLTASFAINTYKIRYVTANAGGSIVGSATQVLVHGSSGTTVTAVPAAAAHYHFVSWSDGELANERREENVTAGGTFTANFALDTYTVTYASGDGGTLTGSPSQTVEYNGNSTPVTAVPNPGYKFVKWSDGVTANPRTDSGVVADTSVSAEFAKVINTALVYRTPAKSKVTYTRRSGVARFTLSAVIKGWGGNVVASHYVYLQSSKNGKSWSNTYKIKTSSKGKAAKAFRITTKRVRYYRWYVPAKSQVCLKTYSKQTKVTVR